MTNTITQDLTPRAWVGCLGCYNVGSLNGLWLDGDVCDDLIAAGLAIDGAHSPICKRCGSDEFNVFDHENFAGIITGECPPSQAADAARELAGVDDNEREILAAWLANGMPFDLDAMRDAYIGEYSHDEAMAEEYLDSTGLLDDAPEFLVRYFDLAAYAYELAQDMFEINGHYFRAY